MECSIAAAHCGSLSKLLKYREGLGVLHPGKWTAARTPVASCCRLLVDASIKGHTRYQTDFDRLDYVGESLRPT